MSYVYFIKATTSGLIKIGRAVNVDKRLKSLQHISPDRLILLGVLAETLFSETSLHTRFAESHSHGEWFKPTIELIEFITNNAVTSIPLREPPPPFPNIHTPGMIGNIIKAHRVSAGLTQQDLADIAQVSRQLVVEVERGKPRAEIGKVLALVNALNIPLMARLAA